jgi:acetylornithine/succinyldiaminopimelate/putrescine aminotransferase
MDEADQIAAAQADFVNFYPEDGVNPYVALAARGPWIVTLKGAVVYDVGGYGMLGFGHTPKAVMQALARPQAMANVMTPSLSQLRFGRLLKGEIGRSRGGCPYARFFCLNSGSEAVTLAARIADANAKLMTDPGARHAGRTIKRLAIKGGFHGRTEKPAIYSDSSRKAYVQNLASFRDEHSMIVVEPYNVEQLRQAFADAERNGWFIEAMFIEPVMGEGDPGRAMTPEFYAAARELTRAHGSLLLVDSIQAGLRAHGVLSIVDYPGFEKLDAPDMETYSKALNAGQYPLSVVAVTAHAAGLYKKGIYGNTMTANPRALDVACAVLEALTDDVRANIRARGREFIERLNQLKTELPKFITKVQGTGLLFSCELSPAFKCFGSGSTEEWMREHGYGVVHGGASSLRFTPHFNVGADEVGLLVEGIRRALVEGPRATATLNAAA